MNAIDGTDKLITIDGCLCNVIDKSKYQHCMDQVRQRMSKQLDDYFIPELKSLIESDCRNLSEHCKT